MKCTFLHFYILLLLVIIGLWIHSEAKIYNEKLNGLYITRKSVLDRLTREKLIEREHHLMTENHGKW